MDGIVQTSTADLAKSLHFYRQLNYTIVQEENPALVTDGQVWIQINADRFARTGILLYRSNWEPLIDNLKKRTTLTAIESGYLVLSPSGTWVYLIQGNSPAVQNSATVSSSDLQNFAGVSLESIDIETSLDFWQLLGFSITMGGAEQSWISLKNTTGFTLSIMKPQVCPHLFYNPSLTYFNGKNNLEIIEHLRAKSIEFTQEISHFNTEGIVDNVIIRDPFGLGFFIFND